MGDYLVVAFNGSCINWYPENLGTQNLSFFFIKKYFRERERQNAEGERENLK